MPRRSIAPRFDVERRTATLPNVPPRWHLVPATRRPRHGLGPSRGRPGTTARPDGKSQLTYNHPLYTFVNDQKPGIARGDGVSAFGASWLAVSAAGAKVAPPKKPQSGGGY